MLRPLGAEYDSDVSLRLGLADGGGAGAPFRGGRKWCCWGGDADIWEPLLAIADEAGGTWPERARVAAVELVGLTKERSPSLGIRLLGDIREVFDASATDRLFTRALLDRLNANTDAPWGDLKGKPLDERGLASMLKEYDIRPMSVRIGGQTSKGYRRRDFEDAWSRYLPRLSREDVTSVTSDTCTEESPLPNSVAPNSSTSSSQHPPVIRVVTDVTDVTEPEEEGEMRRSTG